MTIPIDLWLMVSLLLVFFVVGLLVGIGMCMSIARREEVCADPYGNPAYARRGRRR